MFEDLHLTPVTGTILVFLVVAAGHLYRKNWKAEDGYRRSLAWIYGLTAGVGILVLGFLPLKY